MHAFILKVACVFFFLLKWTISNHLKLLLLVLIHSKYTYIELVHSAKGGMMLKNKKKGSRPLQKKCLQYRLSQTKSNHKKRGLR